MDASFFLFWLVCLHEERMPVKDCCRVVLCVRSGKGSERVHGPFRVMLASVPGFLLEDTV